MMAAPSGSPPQYRPPRNPSRSLTGQQERVVDGIRRGLTYAQIGAELGIDRSTVKGHVERIANVLPNDDHLDARDCIFLWAWFRVWSGTATPPPVPGGHDHG